jgi:hypothetical protein
MKNMTMQQLEKTSGGLGLLETILTGLIVGGGMNIINNWSDFRAGLAGQRLPKR